MLQIVQLALAFVEVSLCRRVRAVSIVHLVFLLGDVGLIVGVVDVGGNFVLQSHQLLLLTGHL